MIVKPFLDRFKSSQHENANNDARSSQEKLLLKLLGFSLKLENNDETLIKISRTISFNFNVDSVCISQVNDNSVNLRQVFHDSENIPTKEENWSLDSINLELMSSKCEQYFENVKDRFIDHPLIKKFQTESILCIPAIDDQGNVIAIINIFHRKAKNYDFYEIEALKLLAQRIIQYFQYETAQSQQSTEKTESNDINQQLQQTQEQLAATNKSLESLSFAVSHELRAPLRSMDSFSNVLVEDFAKNLPDEALDYISRIRKASVRMGHMIDDLLWLARVTRRKIELQNVDLSKLVNKLARELMDAEENRNIELSVEPKLFVIADKDLLKIALQHLLSNAFKFSRLQETTKIEFFAETQGENLVYAIRDNGSGFDMAYYDQLFEPFKQLHHSNKYDGTGIGLATVQRIIERHHGQIWAESDMDDGAIFYFTIPND